MIYRLILPVLLIFWIPTTLLGQCPGLERDTLAWLDFESGLAGGWELDPPSDGGSWQLDQGKIGYYANPGKGNWLYVNDEVRDDIGKAAFYSPFFNLDAYPGGVTLEFDLLFQEFEGKSFFKMEVWDGRDWEEIYFLDEDFSGRIGVDLKGIDGNSFQFRFIYDDEGSWAWGMGLDNICLNASSVICGNGICDPGESPEACLSDCKALASPADFWIAPHTDIHGQEVEYEVFNRHTACDDCGEKIALGFTYSFFGDSYQNVFINSNGNVSFEESYVIYTPEAFCLSGPKMIAPFFGDVDISKGGEILYFRDPEGHYLIVDWIEVAYFGCEEDCDRRNTFQLILTDGSLKNISNRLLPPATTVILNYGDMEWTTGSSSGGEGGLGGSAATVGMNLGDGVICIDYGTFDSEGYGYRGNSQDLGCPPNQVSHLDFRSILLDGENAVLLKEKDIPAPGFSQLEGIFGGHRNTIRWQMEDSSYARHFLLFRGTSPEHLYELMKAKVHVAYQEDSMYFELVDHQPLVGHSFYQIREIRWNGEVNRSEVLELKASTKARDQGLPPFEVLSLGPNPFRDFIKLTYRCNPNVRVGYRISNQMGQIVKQGSWTPGGERNENRLELASLPRGKYFLDLWQGDQHLGRKLIRQ